MARTLEVVRETDNFKDAPEYQAILSLLKGYGEFSVKGGGDEPPTPPEPKTMSKGERMVEEAKARNRAIIAQNTKEDKEASEKNAHLSEMEKLKLEDKRIRDGWKKEILDQRIAWKKEQDIFLGRVKVYKENTFDLPIKEIKIVEKKVPVSDIPDVHMVNGTFNVPIRDQKDRPTCAAFAGIKVVEILLAQNKKDLDLSEQYFYWASKPNCQSSPCSERGSWMTPGYRHSQNFPGVDIPEENICLYKGEAVPQNETQVPLNGTCKNGSVKVVAWEEVRTLADVVEKIKNHTPVILSAKLTENFYVNQGLITLEESAKVSERTDGHSQGHAFVGVGLMELPKKLQEKGEGNFCIIVANSWGKGWGAGGYSCITEGWLAKFRTKSIFVAVTRVDSK